MKGLVLLRQDIRLDDNPALKNAFEENQIVHVLFIYSFDQLKSHNESDIKISFLIENIKILDDALDKLNVGLSIIKTNGFESDPAEILSFFEEHNFDTLYFNNTFGEDENSRDVKIKKLFDESNLSYKTFTDQILFEPGSIRTIENKPYSVFTPFKRKWLENFNIDLLDIEYKYVPKNKKILNSNINNFEFNGPNDSRLSQWELGEEGAKKTLKNFLKNKVKRYNEDRNDPIIEGTSRISPYLALGILSSKRCILEALKLNDLDIHSGNKGILKWIDEIVWREFYRNIMHSFPKVSKGKPFQE